MNTDIITLTEIQGTDSVSSSRITINNNFKNDIVRNSGFRYIDGAAAVGDDGNGNWFTGFEQSSSDHNHTSAKGAMALFMRILTDFPEIASNSL